MQPVLPLCCAACAAAVGAGVQAMTQRRHYLLLPLIRESPGAMRGRTGSSGKIGIGPDHSDGTDTLAARRKMLNPSQVNIVAVFKDKVDVRWKK